MTLAWVVIIPVGTLAARHRHLLFSDTTLASGKPLLWFRLHLFLQVCELHGSRESDFLGSRCHSGTFTHSALVWPSTVADFIIHLRQLLGVSLFTLGFAIAWTALPGLGRGTPTGGCAGRAHQVLGTVVFVLACIQVNHLLLVHCLGAAAEYINAAIIWGHLGYRNLCQVPDLQALKVRRHPAG